MDYSSQENRSWDLVNAGILFALFTIFAYPLLACWSLSYDENVQYWIGTYMFWWTLPIPIWFLIHYFIQIQMTKPKGAMVVWTFILPCVIFFLLGGSMRFRAQSVMDRISGEDCTVYKDNRALVQAHERAVEKYKVCHPAGGKSGFDVLFQSCAKYETWRKEDGNAKHWDYLMYLETNFACTGFCQPAEESLWSHKEYHEKSNWDACFNVVYSVMLSKVARGGLMLMTYPVFVIVGFLFWHYSVRPTFQKMSEGTHGHWKSGFFEKASEVANFARGKAHDAYGAVQHGVEHIKDDVNKMYSPRQPMPAPPPQPVSMAAPPPQPTFVPASQPMAANTLPTGQFGGGANWSAPPAPGYANPQLPANETVEPASPPARRQAALFPA
eukprot:gnl/MRDRNA2_/MRDRNA2_136954_c0_seq1.p1 gnl/MRDRNA2_/MRDRNA2_136954_c0~~gnl/MRDRNA2_/MRDRNA2_136954_c0_seq1.p1  ORF type:complete len:383 (-),score=63.36 gnl/MRDRNA2_/MRDRNA2_136954_c0_seq1:2-1150(-)